MDVQLQSASFPLRHPPANIAVKASIVLISQAGFCYLLLVSSLYSSMNGQRGDDLDDDFVPDELIATSGEEDEVDNHPDDDLDALLSADDDAEAARSEREKSTVEKKRKRREKEKERKAKVRMSPLDCGAHHRRVFSFAEEEVGRNSRGYRTSFSGSATCSQTRRLCFICTSQSLPCNV